MYTYSLTRSFPVLSQIDHLNNTQLYHSHLIGDHAHNDVQTAFNLQYALYASLLGALQPYNIALTI